MTRHAGCDGRVLALVLVALGVWGVARLPTAFIPIEDQGYLVVARATARRRLAGAARRRRWRQVSSDRAQMPGVDQVIAIAGISPLDNNASLSNAGAAYVMLKDWSERGRRDGPICASHLRRAAGARWTRCPTASRLVIVPPPIQGIGNASGFTMQVELRDGSIDFAEAASALAPRIVVTTPRRRPRCSTWPRRSAPSVPQIEVRRGPHEGRDAAVSRSAMYSARCRAMSAPATSTSSTNSAAPSRFMCRPTRASG